LQLLTILTQEFVHITPLTLVFHIPYRGYIGYAVAKIAGERLFIGSRGGSDWPE
jgi:hypothetical protein